MILRIGLTIFIALLLAAGLVWADLRDAQRIAPYTQTPERTTITYRNATSTESVPRFYTHSFDAEFEGQGVCLRIKDYDGSGYTYLSANDGALSSSVLPCW